MVDWPWKDHTQEQLAQIIQELHEEAELLREENRILREIRQPRLAFIKITFKRGNIMAEGPVAIQIGGSTVASIDGFDQNGAPFTGTIPSPAYSIDTPTIASIAPDANVANEDITGVTAGVANLTATVQGANGPLTDTEPVTVLAAAPILSSIKLNFNAPVAPAAKKA